MKLHYYSAAYGTGFTAVMALLGMGLFGLADRVHWSVASYILLGLAVITTATLLPGVVIGALSLNLHGPAFIVLTLVADAVFYSIVSYRLLERRRLVT